MSNVLNKTSFAIACALLLCVNDAQAQQHDHAAMQPQEPMDSSNHSSVQHSAHHMHQAQMPAPLPRPTAEEIAAAFPPMNGMDMSLHMNENPAIAVFQGEQLEYVEGDQIAWDLRVGAAKNFDKFWLRSEGERPHDGDTSGSVELQWAHATGPWWDRVVSLRSDFSDGPSRQWVGIGVTGIAPYKFELEAHAYVGTNGRLAARVEGEYELLLTNRLILTPRVEFNAYSKEDRENLIGSGISNGEAGIRLRYEITRQIAPYIGYTWHRSLGNTANLMKEHDAPVLDHGWVAGLRFWF